MPVTRKSNKRSGPDVRVPSLKEEVRALAYKRGPEAKLPTVRELCESLGTSWGTLSDVLDQLEAQNVIYRKPGSGVYVSPKIHQKTVSLVCALPFFRSASNSPFWGLLVEKLQEEAWKRSGINNETFSFHTAMPDDHIGDPLQEGLIKLIQTGHIDGAIGLGLRPEAADWIMRQEIPFVTFAVTTPWLVRFDEDDVLRLGVAALAEQGCRNIGLWQPGKPIVTYPVMEIYPGSGVEVFREALQACNLELYPELLEGNPNLQYQPIIPMGSRREQGDQMALEVFGDHSRLKPDGLVITDDMLTSGAVAAMQKMGIRVGTDVKIATHANIGSHTLHVFERDLTLIAVDPSEIASEMFDMLTILMNGETPPEGIVSVKPKIIREPVQT